MTDDVVGQVWMNDMRGNCHLFEHSGRQLRMLPATDYAPGSTVGLWRSLAGDQRGAVYATIATDRGLVLVSINAFDQTLTAVLNDGRSQCKGSGGMLNTLLFVDSNSSVYYTVAVTSITLRYASSAMAAPCCRADLFVCRAFLPLSAPHDQFTSLSTRPALRCMRPPRAPSTRPVRCSSSISPPTC